MLGCISTNSAKSTPFKRPHTSKSRNDNNTKIKSLKAHISHETVRVSRQKTDKDHCLFCQVDLLNESLQCLPNINRSNLNPECPTSLKLYKICSSHIYNAMGGDIK